MDDRASATQNATIRLDKSLLRQGIEENPAAIEAMFRQFIPPNERILSASYLGCLGTSYLPRIDVLLTDWADWILLFCIGLFLTLTVGVFQRSHCFGLVTERRVAIVRTGLFGEVLYQDAYLEYVNCSFVRQPSQFGLYLLYTCAGLMVVGGLLLLAFVSRSEHLDLFSGSMGTALVVAATLAGIALAFYLRFAFHVFVKSGLIFGTKKGMPVAMFTDRNRLFVANRMQRILSEHREHRRVMAGVWRLSR